MTALLRRLFARPVAEPAQVLPAPTPTRDALADLNYKLGQINGQLTAYYATIRTLIEARYPRGPTC